LHRLLRSLRQLDPATPPHEIIVVDNDVGQTAEPTVRRAQGEGLPLRYCVEPVRGIARARNRSLELATGDFVAFIDDDEEADPHWLARLWGEVLRHDDDGGVGPVVPKFNAHTPRWLIEGRFFERPRLPTGTILAAWQARTGNALIRRKPLLALPGPFDERFDLTGGEDTDLFRRLIEGGCRFIAVDQAVVYEHVPAGRTTLRWLLQRRFLVGMGEARLYTMTVPVGARRRWQRVRPLLSGIGWGAVGVLLFPVFRISGGERLLLAARHLGRCAFHSGVSYRPYARDSWR
jgi:cellulose synthase/poly-beta-1,6-N-acetylglucosamine synthase-like glycosyltransferase